MQAIRSSAHLAAMDTERGAAIQRRLDAIGISDREFSETSGIDRKTLRRAVAGEERVRPSTYAAIESALDRLEEEAGMHAPPLPQVVSESGTVTFRLSGQFGVDVVVQGPVSNMAELESSVERLIRTLKERTEES